MFYILGLFLIIGLILGGFSGILPFGLNVADVTSSLSNALSNLGKRAYEFVFPKSENEILVDNLNSNYDLLDKFFSQSSDKVLNSKNLSTEEKKVFKQALEAFNQTKSQVKILGTEIVKNKSGVVESLIKKALGLDAIDSNKIDSPDPTYIPPNCNLVCGNQ